MLDDVANCPGSPPPMESAFSLMKSWDVRPPTGTESVRSISADPERNSAPRAGYGGGYSVGMQGKQGESIYRRKAPRLDHESGRG